MPPPIAGAAGGLPSMMEGLQTGSPSAGGPQAGGQDPVQAKIDVIRSIRQAMRAAEAFPDFRDELKVIQQALLRMTQKAGQGAPVQNASAGALPVGG